MPDITAIVTMAMRESRAWPAVLETGTAQELWRAAHEALTAAGFVIVPHQPTPEMIIAGAEADIEYSTRVLGLENTVVSQGPYDHWVVMLDAAPKIGGDDDRS